MSFVLIKNGFKNVLRKTVFHCPNSFMPNDSTTSHFWLCSLVKGLTLTLTQLGAFFKLFPFAHANFGFHKIPIVINTTISRWTAITPKLESNTWKRQYELMTCVKISKDVPSTKSSWFQRPLSQSNDDQDNTLDVTQLQMNIEKVFLRIFFRIIEHIILT